MANWFTSFGESLANGFSGHGFQDNSARAAEDARNEKKKKDELARQASAPVIQQPIQQQRPSSPLDSGGVFTMPTGPKPTQTITQQPVAPAVPSQASAEPRTPQIPKPQGMPTVNNQMRLGNGLLDIPGSRPNAVAPNGVLVRPTVPQPAQNRPQQKGILQNIGDFLGDAWKNTTGMINDYSTDPNNVPRNVIDYIFGINNPLDGATLDYSNMVDGKPTLIPYQPKTFAEAANRSLGGTLINDLLIKPTVGGFQQLANTGSDAIGGFNPSEMATATHYGDQSTQDGFYGVVNELNRQLGLTPEETRNPFVKPIETETQSGIDPFGHPVMGSVVTGANLLGILAPLAGLFSKGTKASETALKEGINIAEDGSAAGRATPQVTNDIKAINTADEAIPTNVGERPTPNGVITNSADSPLLLTENATGGPRPNGVLSSNGPSGFVTKTPQQASETQKAIELIRAIDKKTNVIRQGKTNLMGADEARELIRQRQALIDVVQGRKTLDEALNPPKPAQVAEGAPDEAAVANGATVDGQADLGTPGAVPNDGVVSATPTKGDIQDIIDNTTNPTPTRTPKQKLTPQNEMQSVRQSDVDNLTGELGVNEKGQVYQKVSQEAARDRAVKNLLGGKSPKEYLQTAKQTGEADSAELALLLERTPQDSPIWAELASLKGKLATQKGQALALLERTMRQTATPAQLTSRTLQKAATAGFDTAEFADEVAAVNKSFTDARDAYSAVLNNADATNAEIQAAKDAFVRATKESFVKEGDILKKAAKTKEQKNLAYNLQKKADVYLQGMATSSLTSSPTSVLRNFAQGVGALTHQAGLTPKVEAAINRAFKTGGKTGSFDASSAKTGLKIGSDQLKSEISARAQQLGIGKNPATWLRHPISTIRQATTTGTELGNIPMEAAIRGGMGSEYKQILKAQGYKGDELARLTERNTITDPLNIREKYAQEINALNGLSNGQYTAGTFRKNMKDGFTKLGVTDRTAEQIADFADRAVFGFLRPTLTVAKKGTDYATGGLGHIAPAIVKLSRGDKDGFVSEIAKTISTGTVTLPTWGATGYALAKAGILSQNDYGEWEIGGVPISGYIGAFSAPLAMGAIVGENQREENGAFDGFAEKAYQTLANMYPYGDIGDKFGSIGAVASGLTGGVRNGQDAYGFKEGVADLTGSLAKEAIPASAFLNTLTKMLGGNVKETKVDNPKNANVFEAGAAGLQQAGNKVAAGIPGVSNLLEDRTDSFGDTIKKPNAGLSFLGASNPSAAQNEKATGITAVGSKGLNSVAKANLTTEDEKTAYNEVVKKLEDEGKDVSNSNVFKELAAAGKYELASKYDENINQDLETKDKTALAKYNAMDSDHQKAYLQNQKNALDTYSAQLNNKQANGVLLDEDTDTSATWGGSGNSLMVKALVAKTNVENNVPKSTIKLYKEVTSKKIYNSLNAEQKAALDAYSAQLAANGVTVRDFLSGGSGSGGGSGKSAADGFVLTKAVTSGGGSTGKFAHQGVDVSIPQVVKPMPQYVIKQRKISVD